MNAGGNIQWDYTMVVRDAGSGNGDGDIVRKLVASITSFRSASGGLRRAASKLFKAAVTKHSCSRMRRAQCLP